MTLFADTTAVIAGGTGSSGRPPGRERRPGGADLWPAGARALPGGRPPLARISHQASAAAADTGMSAAFRSVGLLDVLFKYVSGALGRAPCIHARLHRLATNLGEKCGLAEQEPGDAREFPR